MENRFWVAEFEEFKLEFWGSNIYLFIKKYIAEHKQIIIIIKKIFQKR